MASQCAKHANYTINRQLAYYNFLKDGTGAAALAHASDGVVTRARTHDRAPHSTLSGLYTGDLHEFRRRLSTIGDVARRRLSPRQRTSRQPQGSS